MAVAAIWDNSKPEPDILIPSCCVLTTQANKFFVNSSHDRMPWILSEEQQREWLKPEQFLDDDLEEMMHDNSDIPLECYPVTPSVNSAFYKENDTIQPLKK